MTASATMTIRVSPETKEKLDRIAAEALADYADRELEIIAGIKRGMADAEAGRVVPHDQAMAEIYAVIDAAEVKRASKA